MSKSQLPDKLNRLQDLLASFESVLVTFSGGVDSTFLAKVAFDQLGDRSAVLLAVSPSLPAHEREAAQALAGQIGISLREVSSRELENPQYGQNGPNRCYFCKSELFSIAAAKAKEWNFKVVLDGMQSDDLQDHRPGHQAAKEWQIRSPLAEVGLTKKEIRTLSRQMNLPTWDKPEMACLASRIPTGTPVTFERLSQVERCEAAVKGLGFRQIRARHHDQAVRLEFDPEEMDRLDAEEDQVIQACRSAGFLEVWIDLKGYARG